MNKWYLPIGILLLLVFLVMSGSRNYQIYTDEDTPGVLNWGLNGGINAFAGGLITFCIALIAILISLWIYSIRFKDKRPKELIPVDD